MQSGIRRVLCLWVLSLLYFADGQTERRERVTVGDTSNRVPCNIQMTGIEGNRRREATIETFIQCNEDTLLDDSFSISNIKEISLDNVDLQFKHKLDNLIEGIKVVCRDIVWICLCLFGFQQ